MTPAALADLLAEWGYIVYLGLLCATGVGSPVPEDLLLLTGGYLISAGVFSWTGAFLSGVFGVVASDVMLYGWGRRIRRGAESGWTRRILPHRRLDAASGWIGRFGSVIVLVARLVPGTRAIVFLSAGVRGMPLRSFLIFDVLGAAMWVPIALALGARVGREIGGLDQLLAAFGRVGGWTLAVAVLLVVLWQFWRTEESKL